MKFDFYIGYAALVWQPGDSRSRLFGLRATKSAWRQKEVQPTYKDKNPPPGSV